MPSVLLIEDEPDTRETLAELLAADGWAVHAAEHAEAGLAALEAGLRPDVLLCDHFLPGRLGSELRAHLAGHPELGRIPFFFMSASPRHLRSLPDVRTFAKPLDLDKLLRELRTAAQG